MVCDRAGNCHVEKCVPGQDLCRTTVLHIFKGGDELEVVERGCAHQEKTNRTMSYRTGMEVIALMEVVCETPLCNQWQPATGRKAIFPYMQYLECASCASSDLSCERGRTQSLQCRRPGEQCLEIVTHRDPDREPLEESAVDDRHILGCGYIPGCSGPSGFHNNHSFHFLRCCNTTNCNGGPVTELHKLPLNDLQCYSCEGNSTHGCSKEETSLVSCRGPMTRCLEATGSAEGLENQNIMVRGCATPSWCQGLHVAEVFSLFNVSVSCCTGDGCNHPVWNGQPRMGGAPCLAPAYLILLATLLTIFRLWGDPVL